ncbi:MAG: TatD family hydrolase [Bacteroidales bacterium]
MELIDTHTHIYLEQFDYDRAEVVDRAEKAQVSHFLMPNIDSHTVVSMMAAARQFPGRCLPMMGLHPTSVKTTYHTELANIEGWLKKGGFVAVGETGIDLYWDKTYKDEQQESLEHHIHWAREYSLPLVLHSRNSLNELFDVLMPRQDPALKGVFHCFPGNAAQAAKVIDMGFMLGIGGVVTYKNSLMADVVKAVNLSHLILETDAPFLSPVPFRGKRNESAYLPHIAERIAEIKGIDVEEVAGVTTANARRMFGV